MMQQRLRPIHYQVTPPRPRRRFGGSVVSLVAHLILIALLLITIDHDFATAVDRGTTISPLHGGGGGGGGGGVQFVALPEAPHAAPPAAKPVVKPVESTPLPIVTKTPETIPPPVVPTPAEPAAATATTPAATAGDGGPGTGGGTGGGNGTGDGPGTGTGSGPGNGSGAGGKGKRLTTDFLPPFTDAPKDYRNKTVVIHFWVDAAGKPTRVELDPAIDNKGFREKFVNSLMAWRFRPSRDGNGVAVADTISITQKF